MDKFNTATTEDDGEVEDTFKKEANVIYSVEDTPPWYLCLFLGFQHFLTSAGATLSIPFLLSKQFCLDDDIVGLSELIGTIFFVSGIATLLQTTFGVRLPIIQGGTFSFLVPTVAIMAQTDWECKYTILRETNGTGVNFTAAGLWPVGSEGHREYWMKRIREIQGAIMVASVFQVIVGFSGIMGFVLRFIGPLAIAPTIALIGLSLFVEAANQASEQWWIALTTMFLITLFSQYLQNVKVPFCSYNEGRWKKTELQVFTLFPVLLAMIISWVLCVILTATDALPTEEDGWGYKARTDVKSYVLEQSKWFRFPYPGQWGLPTISTASVFGMLAGVISSMIESVGDYYACARLAGAPPPPTHAVNRGIGIEGIACILAGAWGSGNGTTSYSENIGAIGITKVGSTRVVQIAGIIMLILGCLGKFGALFATIPEPVVGGMFMVAFGMVTAVGLSNLQHVNLNSPRNIFILGLSLFFGLSLPVWMTNSDNKGAVDVGNDIVNQIITVLLSTSMFVGGLIGFVLDNTIPGTPEERGILTWRTQSNSGNSSKNASRLHIYDLPLIQPVLDRFNVFRYIPCCPRFLSKESLENNTSDEDVERNGQFERNVGYDNPIMASNKEWSSDTQL